MMRRINRPACWPACANRSGQSGLASTPNSPSTTGLATLRPPHPSPPSDISPERDRSLGRSALATPTPFRRFPNPSRHASPFEPSAHYRGNTIPRLRFALQLSTLNPQLSTLWHHRHPHSLPEVPRPLAPRIPIPPAAHEGPSARPPHPSPPSDISPEREPSRLAAPTPHPLPSGGSQATCATHSDSTRCGRGTVRAPTEGLPGRRARFGLPTGEGGRRLFLMLRMTSRGALHCSSPVAGSGVQFKRVSS
jgi:hypothetical protein